MICERLAFAGFTSENYFLFFLVNYYLQNILTI